MVVGGCGGCGVGVGGCWWVLVCVGGCWCVLVCVGAKINIVISNTKRKKEESKMEKIKSKKKSNQKKNQKKIKQNQNSPLLFSLHLQTHLLSQRVQRSLQLLFSFVLNSLPLNLMPFSTLSLQLLRLIFHSSH